MTGPRIDFGALDDWSYGDRAAKDNQYWLQTQSDVLRQMRDDLDLLKQTNFVDVSGGASSTSPLLAPPPEPLVKTLRGLFQLNRTSKDSDSGRHLIQGIHQLENMSMPELHGRAKALGIDSPERVPAELLRQEIANRRLDVAPSSFNALRNVASQIANFGVGFAETVVNQTQQWLGPLGEQFNSQMYLKDVVKSHRSVDDNAEMFARLKEGVRANQDPTQLGKYQSGAAGVVGSLAGGIAVSLPLFRAFSAVTNIPMFGSLLGKYDGPLMRGAVAGGLTSLAFDTGSEKPWLPSEAHFARAFDGNLSTEDRAVGTVEGIFGSRLMSAVVGEALGALAMRLGRDFPTSTEPGLSTDTRMAGGPGRSGGGDGFSPWGDDVVDAEWEWASVATRDNPPDFRPESAGALPAPGLPPAGGSNTAALEARYLRRLGSGDQGDMPGLSTLDMSIDDVNTPQTPRGLLQGPRSRELEGDYQNAVRMVEIGEQNLSIAVQSGDESRIAHAAGMLENWQKQIEVINKVPRMTRTPYDITPELIQLRAKEHALEQMISPTGTSTYNPSHPAMSELSNVKYQIDDLKKSAGLARRSADPQHWEWFKQNAPKPATPAQRLVDQYGTSVRHEDGTPKQVYHGTSSAYAEIDPSTLGGNGNLFGPGFYVTDNPNIAGGDILEPWEMEGYAAGRASGQQQRLSQLQHQLLANQDIVDEFEMMLPSNPYTRDQYEGAKQMVNLNTQLIADFKAPSPNVRNSYIAVKKVFDADGQIDREEAFQIMKAVGDATGADMTSTREMLEFAMKSPNMKDNSTIPGQILYDSLKYEEMQTSHANGWPATMMMLGDSVINEALQTLGYDAVHYIANIRVGGGRYKDSHAWNVFNPRNVISTYLPEEVVQEAAAALGIQMSRQADILQSPALENMAHISKFTDADAVIAQMASNPGSMTVVQGIVNPGEVIQRLADDTANGSIAGILKSYRVVQRKGRNDLIVSSLGPIDDQMVRDYERLGVFTGMDVVKANGQQAKVMQVYEDGALKVQTPAQVAKGLSNTVYHTLVAPSRTASGVVAAPDLYEGFKTYAVTEVNERVLSSGQLSNADWFDPAVFHRMPDLLNDYLSLNGITDTGVRAAIVRDFNIRRVEDAKQFAPEWFEVLDGIRAEAGVASELAMAKGEGLNPFDYAQLRGFNLVPNEGRPGYVLEDTLSELKIPMKDREAVTEFLDHYQRDLPEHTPPTVFPAELIETGNDAALMHSPDESAIERAMINDLAEMESFNFDDVFVSRSSTSDWEPTYNPREGDQYSGRVGGGGNQPPLPPGAASTSGSNSPKGRVKAMVKKELSGYEGQMGELMARYDGMMIRVFTPMRSIFSRLQDDLGEMGIAGLKPWQDFDDVTYGVTKAHNEANPILSEIGHEMRFVPKQVLRNGEWWQLWEVTDPVQRIQYARGLGWDDDAVKSFHKVDTILDNMLGGAGGTVQEFKSFVAGVRSAQARGDYSRKAYEHGKNMTSIRHFVDHSTDVGAIFLQNDPRTLLPDFIRSFTFAKHAGESWNNALTTWQAVEQITDEIGHRPFAKLAGLTLDWLDYVQRGYQPGPDYALSTVHNIVNSVLQPMTGTKITRGETRAFIQTLQTGFYRGALGLRIHVMVRDAIQPLLALPFVGPKHLASTMATVSGRVGGRLVNAGQTEAYEDMIERTFESGVAELAMPRLESPGMFEGLMATNTEGGVMTPENIKSRERIARYTDAVTEILSPGVRTGVKKHLDTLRFYTAQGMWHRIIAGESAYRRFMEDFTAWDAKRSAGLPVTFKEFAKDINLHSWGSGENRAIEEAIGKGDIKGASHIYMRLVADRTQFAYGTRHAPPGVRTTTGKLALMLGNFTVQTLDLVRNISKTKSLDVAGKMAATLGMIHYLLGKVEDETGWPTKKMSPLYAFTFMGGPPVDALVGAYQTGKDVLRLHYNETSNRPVDNRAQGKVSRISVPGMAFDVMNQFNPIRGAMDNFKGIYQAANSSDPLYSAGRFLATGATQGLEIDNEHRLRQTPEIQSILDPQTYPVTAPSMSNPRTLAPTVRLPGASQYQPVQRGNSAITDSLMEQFVEKSSRKQGTHGSGGGAF